MAVCKHCGKPLILNKGKCVYCGMTPGLPPVLTFTVKDVSFKMILVEGGTFYMGLTPKEAQKFTSEGVDWRKKVQIVTLNSYYIGETVVTQALWKAIMDISIVTPAFWKSSLGDINNPSKFKGDNLPVENVSWQNCQEFITRLNEQTESAFRLPLEAEWEFASKGGNLSRGYEFSGSNNYIDVAWLKENDNPRYLSTTKPVKTKFPNELGMYDMTGNVWEWCQDEYNEDYVRKYGDHGGNHQDVQVGLRGAKILRGFSAFWPADIVGVYPSYRNYQSLNRRNPSLLDNGRKIEGFDYDAFGFRLALNANRQ